jgi:hypothetical protein
MGGEHESHRHGEKRRARGEPIHAAGEREGRGGRRAVGIDGGEHSRQSPTCFSPKHAGKPEAEQLVYTQERRGRGSW